MIDTKFGDLFLCIGCRACNKHCPIRHAFGDADHIWTPKIYLTQFVRGDSESVDVCLHCEACRIECPVDIDLPYLMWQAKLDYVHGHGTSLSHKVLGRPELLARMGTGVAPVANWALGQKLVRVPMEKITGIDRRTRLPRFFGKTFRKRLGNNGSAGTR
jgi:glycerol-3-phosphate dehydrogenase subunit C